jgi:hypothetical protein
MTASDWLPAAIPRRAPQHAARSVSASGLLREVGPIKSSPQQIIADGTDWRFLNEIKRELKA